MSIRDVPTPNERAERLATQDPIEVQTKALEKRERVIRRLSHALLETGLFTPDEVELIKNGQLSDLAISEAIKQSHTDMNPPKPKVMVRYVLGFAFNYDQTHVLLMWKNRPAWQAGQLNGVGGKIEDDETADQAMIREFAEETGINTEEEIAGTNFVGNEIATWLYVGKRCREALYDNQLWSYEMHIYATHLPLEYMKLAQYHNTDEEVVCLPLNMEILRRRGVPGLAWTVDAALCSLTEGFHIKVSDPVNYLEVEE